MIRTILFDSLRVWSVSKSVEGGASEQRRWRVTGDLELCGIGEFEICKRCKRGRFGAPFLYIFYAHSFVSFSPSLALYLCMCVCVCVSLYLLQRPRRISKSKRN